MKSIIASHLTNDATLMSLLTGGVVYDKIEINRQITPSAFDSNGIIKPCVLIKANDIANVFELTAQQIFDIFIYTPPLSSSEAIVERLYTILNDAYISGVYYSNVFGSILDRDDPSIKSRLDIISIIINRSL